MTCRFLVHSRKISLLGGVLLFLGGPPVLMGEPTPAAISAFNTYTHTIELRLAQQHRSPLHFLSSPGPESAAMEARLLEGEVDVEQLTPPADASLAGALLHHWRGTAFVPGASAADLERLLRDFRSYPQYFAPQVLQARTNSWQGDSMQTWMRIRQHHVITVVMDASYDVTFGRLDTRHGYSISQSTRIDEIDSPGTRTEQALGPRKEHGFLWRLNTYWSYEERDGGLYLQIEAISLTRDIPLGLGWAIGPYVKSIPRESLEFTLHSACGALRHTPLPEKTIRSTR